MGCAATRLGRFICQARPAVFLKLVIESNGEQRLNGRCL
jgi:hypothetical protein